MLPVNSFAGRRNSRAAAPAATIALMARTALRLIFLR
jgi:hypothetical protein